MKLPDDFINQTRAFMGEKLWQALQEGLGGDAPVSIRLNPCKCDTAAAHVCGEDGRVPWCDCGRYLAARPNFTFDPMLHAGLYYVQEASSMFLDLVLRQYGGDTPVTMLDLCAAPGGKSGVARAALPEGSLLVSNEPMRQRAQVLAENMAKLGHEDAIVTNNYARDISRSGLKFDILLADVPCSGEGMFRKDPVAVSEWSLQNVEQCWRLQRDSVADAWPCLREGGLFIYSTCTFNTKEDEENVRHICEELGAEVLSVNINGEWGVTGSLLAGFNAPVYRFMPGLTRGEGLFMAVMRKHGGQDEDTARTKNKKPKKEQRGGKKGGDESPCAKWLREPERFETVTLNSALTAIPKAWRATYDVAAARLNVLAAGVRLGETKGKDIIPSQAVALSRVFDGAAFPSVELDYAQAIAYLRKEAVALPDGTPRGHVVMRYNGVPLGFEKNIGNRANNLYPAEWKIKSTHTPEGNNEVITKQTSDKQTRIQ